MVATSMGGGVYGLNPTCVSSAWWTVPTWPAPLPGKATLLSLAHVNSFTTQCVLWCSWWESSRGGNRTLGSRDASCKAAPDSWGFESRLCFVPACLGQVT